MVLSDFPELARAWPGALGSLLSMLWTREPLLFKRVILFIGGAGFSLGARSWVSEQTNLADGFVLGFLLGLGSMTFFAKCFETWQDLNLSDWLRDVLRKWSGLESLPKD